MNVKVTIKPLSEKDKQTQVECLLEVGLILIYAIAKGG